MRRRVLAILPAGMALLPGGCALLTMSAPTHPAPFGSPAPDEPVPYTLRAAVAPARAALEHGWPHPTPVRFRFLEGRCAAGAAVALVFEQAAPGEPAARALALTHDIAAGIVTNAWWERYDVTDPDADPDLVRLLHDREIDCP